MWGRVSPHALRRLANGLLELANELESGTTSAPRNGAPVTWSARVVGPTSCHRGGFIYFVRVLDAVKIGHANNVQKRVHHVQCCNASPALLVGFYWVADPKSEEHGLHRRFRDQHIRGEWFSWHEDIAELIRWSLAQCYLHPPDIREDAFK